MSKIIDLTQLKIKESAVIYKLNSTEKINNRLISMGVKIGKKITIIKKGLFNSPLLISLDGFNLAIRDSLAKNILVKIDE